jgi:hypothetical protein
MKLCHSVSKAAEGGAGVAGGRGAMAFNRAQKAQLDVYRLVGFLQNELHTDDSFVFNKVRRGLWTQCQG